VPLAARCLAAVAEPARLAAKAVARCRGLARIPFNVYRPEQYYMRGPGPKCRAKCGILVTGRPGLANPRPSADTRRGAPLTQPPACTYVVGETAPMRSAADPGVEMSLAPRIALTDRQIAETQTRLREQKARLARLIVQGVPTQPLEDAVRHLEARLQELQLQRRTIGVAKRLPDHIG